MKVHPRTPVHARPARRAWSAAVASASLAVALTACSSTGATDAGGNAGSTDSNLELVTAIRSLSNPYEAQWVQGAKWYAQSVHLPLKTIVYNGDSQTELADIQAVLATGKTIILDLNVNTSADTQAIARAVSSAGGYVVTEWNSPSNLHPWDIGPHWVAHVSYNGVPGGYDAAKVLFKALGGSGGIIALQGIPDNLPAIQRKAGLEQALPGDPGIKLLSSQIANWDQTQAYNETKTLLTEYGSQIKGVWAANDAMGLGAMQALDEAGRTNVKVVSASDATPQALQDILSGNQFLTTYSTDAYYDGAIGLVLAYQAATGKLNANSLPHSKREFYISEFDITKANAKQLVNPPNPQAFLKTLQDPFSRDTGPIG